MATTNISAQLSSLHQSAKPPDGVMREKQVRGDQLFVLLRENQDRRLNLCVLSGTELLEDLDITAYVDRMNADPDSKNSPNCPLIALTQDCRVSFRYILDNQMQRTFQLRFREEADCTRVVQSLRFHGLPFRQAAMKAQPRPVTAQNPVTVADSARIPPPPIPTFTSDGVQSGSRPASASLSMPALPVPTVVRSSGTTVNDQPSSELHLHSDPYQRGPATKPGFAQFSATLPHLDVAGRVKNSHWQGSTHGGPTVGTSDMYTSDPPIRPASRLLQQVDYDEGRRTVGTSSSDTLPTASARPSKGYADQPVQDRNAQLEDFLIQNLDNPEFFTLCQDVENCWRGLLLHRK